MRAILIDPVEQTLDVVDLPDFVAGIRRHFRGAKLVRIATLPAGDRVHVVVSHDDPPNTFSLGGSGPHRGTGLILGPQGQYGMLKNSRTGLNSIAAIVAFGPDRGGGQGADRSEIDHGAEMVPSKSQEE
jgi:hypothetical protein